MEKLAINGGPKAIPQPLPSFRDKSGRSIGREEMNQLNEVIDSGSLSFIVGNKTALFERAFAEFLGMRHAVAVSSGTAALHAAVISEHGSGKAGAMHLASYTRDHRHPHLR